MTEDETIRATISDAITAYYALAEKISAAVIDAMQPLPSGLIREEAVVRTTLGIIKDAPIDLTDFIIQRLEDKGFAIGAFE